MSKQILLNLTRALGATVTANGAAGYYDKSSTHYQVLILGGGLSGVMAARELQRAGIQDYLLVEARDELGGRLMSHTFDDGLTVELGANWIEGLHTGALKVSRAFSIKCIYCSHSVMLIASSKGV